MLLTFSRAGRCRWARWGSGCRCTRPRSLRSSTGWRPPGIVVAGRTRRRPRDPGRDHRRGPRVGRGGDRRPGGRRLRSRRAGRGRPRGAVGAARAVRGPRRRTVARPGRSDRRDVGRPRLGDDRTTALSAGSSATTRSRQGAGGRLHDAVAASRSSRRTAPTTPSGRASSRSPAGSTRPATAGGPGRSGSSPASATPQQTNERYRMILGRGGGGLERRLRHADPDGPRLRRPEEPRRGRALRRRDRLGGRHGACSSTASRSATSRPR